MPQVPRLVAEDYQSRQAKNTDDSPSDELPEEQSLFFPHQLSLDLLELCSPGLAEVEERLRDAQMHESLDKLRVQLHVKNRIVTYKGRNVRHQMPNTRAQRKLLTNDAKIMVFAEKYRAARRAKLALVGPGEWEIKWRELRREDVRTLSAEDDPVNTSRANVDEPEDRARKSRKRKKHVSEGKRTTSWIWMAADDEDAEAGALRGMHDGAWWPRFYPFLLTLTQML